MIDHIIESVYALSDKFVHINGWIYTVIHIKSSKHQSGLITSPYIQ